MKHDPEYTTENSPLNSAAERSTADCGSAAAVALRLGGNPEGGAPLSNTAPANCTASESGTKILRHGVDSLYLSYAGVLDQTIEEQLERLKLAAQSEDVNIQAQAVFSINDFAFEVLGRGKGRFPYVLQDNWFHLQLSRPSSTLPFCYAQLGSELLTRAGVMPSTEALTALVGGLGKLNKAATVSRIDLCVDFTTKVDLSALPREAWVMRAHRYSTHHEQKVFSGFTFGMGGDIAARLYNKTLETQKSGKDYLLPLWYAGGWDGQATVWRLEFQIRRAVLSEVGFRTVNEVLRSATGLWDYAATQWLRLAIPSPTDQTQTRWLDHPLWQTLQAIEWLDSTHEPLQRIRKQRDPSDERLFVHGLGAITSFMGKTGERDFDKALARFGQAAHAYHRHRSRHTGKVLATYVREKARVKARRYNAANLPKREEE
ncbi:MAG TPA: replication initiation factor [Candidatus Binatia bacterium]|nr:replication initiation factor [Candidatus Binatia bacterium]